MKSLEKSQPIKTSRVMDFNSVSRLNPSRKGDRMKLKVLEATLDILGSQGLAGFTFAAVARKLKVQICNVSFHFPEKENLLYGAFYLFISQTSAHARQSIGKSSPKTEILNYIRADFKWYQKKNHRALIALQEYLCTLDVKLSALFTERRRRGRQRLRELLSAWNGTKNRTEAEIEQLSWDIHELATGYIADFVWGYAGDAEKHLLESKAANAVERLLVCFESNKRAGK